MMNEYVETNKCLSCAYGCRHKDEPDLLKRCDLGNIAINSCQDFKPVDNWRRRNSRHQTREDLFEETNYS